MVSRLLVTFFGSFLGVVAAIMVTSHWPSGASTSIQSGNFLRLLQSPDENLLLKQYDVGTLIAIAGTAEPLPPTWVPCDGRAIARRDYPAMFRRLGEESDELLLPDYRGMNAQMPTLSDVVFENLVLGPRPRGIPSAMQVHWAVKVLP